jgi:molybdopterin-guanine dinucleotide biosynthesis protein MobB
MVHVLGITGYANSGKTTLISRLINIFSSRGLKVASIKHAAHGYQLDQAGHDSWLHYNSGAEQVIVVGPDSMTRHQRLERQPSLQEIIASISGVDIILVEGFKNEVSPRILIYRPEAQKDKSFPPGQYLAVVTDTDINLGIPSFGLNQVEELANFIINYINSFNFS